MHASSQRGTGTCRTPLSASTGAVDVVIETMGGTATLPNGVTYHPPPTLTGVEPDSGFEVGGAKLTLLGSGFTANAAGTNAATVGGTGAAGTVAVDDQTMITTLPVGTVGPAVVQVSNANGQASLPGGFTYFGLPPNFLASDVRLDTDDAGAARSSGPQNCCDGKNVYAVWWDERNGEYDIYFNRSLDAGTTWLTDDVRLDTDVAGAAESSVPQICCSGTNVHVVWLDRRNGAEDTYYNRSTDAGTTWLASDVRVNTDLAGTSRSSAPRICGDETNVWVVWQDERNGSFDIYYSHSTNGGASWLASDLRLDTDTAGAATSSLPRICCDGPNVKVVWQDERSGNWDIYFNHSTDGGTTWLASDVRLDAGGGEAYDRYPEISCDGPNVFVVWQARLSPEIYSNHSPDGGATWLADAVRLDTCMAGPSGSAGPQVCSDGARVYVTWSDYRGGGLADIRFTTDQP